MKVIEVKQLTDKSLMYEACGATLGREISKPDLFQMLKSEHSPIRCLMFKIVVEIPSFVSVHFVRHSATGQLHFVQSLRDDRGGTGKEDRNTPVRHMMILNAQHLIDISRKRLCSKAHPETRVAWQRILIELACHMPELLYVCKPECEYRGGTCYELKGCGKC